MSTINSLQEAFGSNPQDVLNTVTTRLLKQGKGSYGEAGSAACAYISEDGSRCAVGLLLSDEELEIVSHNGINHNGLWDLAKFILPQQTIDDNIDVYFLLRNLQDIHDNMPRHIHSQDWRTKVEGCIRKLVAADPNNLNLRLPEELA